MSEENIKIEGGDGVVQNLDLDKYTDLLLKLDEATDKIKEMEALTKDLKKVAIEVKPKQKFTFSGLFMDDNTINEKAIIGFASFVMMVAFGIVDLVTGLCRYRISYIRLYLYFFCCSNIRIIWYI